MNTLHPIWAARQTKDYGEPQKQMIDVLPLRELLDRYLPTGTPIDLLNIDIEGFDLQALESNDWNKYRPKMICIETHDMDVNRPSENATFRYLQAAGYHMIAHIYATSVYRPHN